MNGLAVGTEFDDWQSLLVTKKLYEEASKTILTVSTSHKLKTTDAVSKICIYDRVEFGCKAGAERKTRSTGLRESSTYKMGCTVKVRVTFNGTKLVVKEANLVHTNHLLNQQVYDHYPENVRLNEDEMALAEKMVKVDGNKKKVKMFLQNERGSNGKPVLLKCIHNIQTKINSLLHAGPGSVLEKLYDGLRSIPNARVRFISDSNGEFVGIFYQDERMAKVFEKFPEVVLYDATHKLNNHQLPLFLQLCIDGNGETEIANLYICRSESREGIGAMIDVFKEFNANAHLTKIFIGDKDFADRSIYTEKYPDAVLQICLYHVLLVFHREITTNKRNITPDQRLHVLEILQQIVYSQTSEQYDALYKQLCELTLKEVTTYYNENWHPIRDEWTLHGRNKFANFLTSTNNRTERVNRTLKQIGSRYSNLLVFFENISTSVAVMSSEKDVKAVRSTMRLNRKRFDDPALQRYHEFLTPFVFKKVEEQFELSHTVRIDLQQITETTFETQNGFVVNKESCTCTFFSAMRVPCRHIFRLLQIQGCDLFEPTLCLERWTKAYYNASHPSLNDVEQRTLPQPVSLQRIRVPDEISKYKKAANLTKDINNIAASMSTSEYEYFVGKVKDLRNEMINSRQTMPNQSGDQQNPPVVNQQTFQPAGNPITQVQIGPVQSTLVASQQSGHSMQNPLPMVSQQTYHPAGNPSAQVQIGPVQSSSVVSQQSGILSQNPTVVISQQLSQAKNGTMVQSQSNSSVRIAIAAIKLPTKNVSSGRPKGSGQTVIGTKKKPIIDLKRKSNVNVDNLPAKKKFIDLSVSEQSIKIVQWLTNKPAAEIERRKVTYSDLIQDSNVFNRLRNDGVTLNGLKNFVDKKCFQYLTDEMKRLKNLIWGCSKCKRSLTGDQIMCAGCLDWYHYNCSKGSNSGGFFCDDCDRT